MRSTTLLSAILLAGGLGATAQSPVATPPIASPALILGKVVEGTGNTPVADALVTLSMRGAPYLNLSVLTDTEGNFVFLDLPPGTYNLRALKDGYWMGEFGQRRFNGPIRTLALTAAQRAADIRVPLWKDWAISGTVVDDLGEPVVGVTVHALTSWVRGGRELLATPPTATAQTDDRGVYRIYGFQPGRVVVAIPPEELAAVLIPRGGSSVAGREFGYAPAFRPGDAGTVEFNVRSGEERHGADFQLRLVRTRTVTGRLTGGPALLGRIKVRLVISDESATADVEVAETESDDDGSFSFSTVAPGNYVLRVVDRSLTETGPGGAYAVAAQRSAAVRRMSVGVDADGYWASARLTVGDSDVTDVSLPLRPSRRVSGRLVFNGVSTPPSPDQIDETLILVERPDGRFIVGPGGARVMTDSTGRFTTFGLPAGHYFLRPSLPGMPAGWALESITIDARDLLDTPLAIDDADLDDVRITFTDKTSDISGSVQAGDGTAATDATVVIFPADSRGWIDFGASPPRMRSVRTGLDGTFAITRLPPGDYLVAAIDDVVDIWQTQPVLTRLSSGATRVTIGSGDKRTLTLRMTQPAGAGR